MRRLLNLYFTILEIAFILAAGFIVVKGDNVLAALLVGTAIYCNLAAKDLGSRK